MNARRIVLVAKAILVNAGKGFLKQRGPEAAAGISFFAIFSLFPLLLLLVAIASLFVDDQTARQQILDTILEFVPEASQDLIVQNFRNIIRARNTVGVIGSVTLLWSASGAFNILTRNLSRAWPEKPVRNIIKVRMVAFGIVAGLFVLLALIYLIHAAVGLIATVSLPLHLGAYVRTLFQWAINIILFFLTLIILTLIYRWAPRGSVHTVEALSGAFPAFVAAELVTAAFGWYLESGFARYNLVYGSLGALVALMFWMYIMNNIILLGAHIASATGRHRRGIGIDNG
jgi:membrane protein